MKISLRKKGSRRVVHVSGSLTVAESLKLKKTLVENLRKGNHLELVFGDISEIDISVIQLMAAAARACESGDREFTVRTPVPDKVKTGLRIAGFLNHHKCEKPGCAWCAINMQVQGA